ncbi:MAG: hypothetical protein DRJ28_00125 [Actinobacteria bacterium]|nr:MAG: hypothetical protein DRJ28_00125 [Actinomycetota bacterium]
MTATIGESDCETISNGLLAQPVNAVSSLAYVVVGGIVLYSITRSEDEERSNRLVFGFLLVATGVGSVLFHGPQGPASRFVHDVTFVLTVLFIAVITISGIVGWARGVQWAVFLSAAALTAIVLAVWPSSTNVLAGASLMLLIASDVLGHRTGAIRKRWWRAAVTAVVIAVALFIAGRTGGPLCDSSSLFQGHAAWHVLSAGALWAYFESTAPVRAGISEDVS